MFRLWYFSKDIIASVINRQEYKTKHLFFTTFNINVVFILMERAFVAEEMVDQQLFFKSKARVLLKRYYDAGDQCLS